MKVDDQRTCSVCGMPLSATSEFCPACMLRIGLKRDVESGESSSDRVSEEPTPSELKVERFENYEVVKREDGTPVELGRGAMGVTYKAIDVDLRCPVALKVISEKYLGDESARLRFLREARAAASVRHPNVASVLHLGRTGSSYFYAMEFVEGETLENLIKHSGRLEVKLALEITAQVAAGLAATHEQNLVHRDIKPPNVMVSVKEGNRVGAKIIDLGLSKTVAESPSQPAISMPGAFAGTPEFASPEQFAGVGVDIRSDLYSLGVTLWEMLTGKVPFRGTPAEVMYQHQHAPLPLGQLIDVPQPIVVLLQVLLEKDPKWRFQNPTQLVDALPKVNDAVKGRRTITHQTLREIVDQQLGASGKAIEILRNLRDVTPVRKVRAIVWAALVTLIGGGAILTVAILFGSKSAAPPAFRSSSPAVTAPEKSVAVLPFESLSDNKSDIYFADGVQDEILNNLAKIAQLKVISRTSVMQYRGDLKRDLRQIASALGVATILEGTVRRDGNHVRISTELIDASNDNTVWADSYDRDLTDIFGIQSEIAKTVALKLSAQLSPEERKDIEERPTNNLEAYDLYLQAKQLIARENSAFVLSKDEIENFSKGINLLKDSIQRDPKFALGFCLIAKAHDFLYSDGLDQTPERRVLGDAAVNEALRLRPDLSEVHLALAFHLYSCYRDFERARVQIAMATRGLSNNPDILELTALIDRTQGHWEKSTSGLEKAETLDPRNAEVLDLLRENYFALRRYKKQEQIQDKLNDIVHSDLITIDKADYAFEVRADFKVARAAYESLPSSMKDDPWITMVRCFLAVCDSEWKSAEEIVRKSPNENVGFLGALAPRGIAEMWLEMSHGNHPTMQEFGATREQLYQNAEAKPTDPFLLSVLGCADVILGRKEEAVREARRAVEMRPISEDAVSNPLLVLNLAHVYAWANEPDLALEQLNILFNTPNLSVSYGLLKRDPGWDSLRKDPRFDKLLAEFAPLE
jgi:TolB-like protein